MGAEEDCSAIVTVSSERPQPTAQISYDPTAQQRWSELETIYLIRAYQEKWYMLKKGQLKARDWEEVANKVFLSCGGNEPSKSSVQCRHKIEKLRKRYREEKQLEEQRGPGTSTWPYFERMDAMEMGGEESKVNNSASATPASNGTPRRTTRFRIRWQDRSIREHETTMSLNDDIIDNTSPPQTRLRTSWHRRGNAVPEDQGPHMSFPKFFKHHVKDESYLEMDGKTSVNDDPFSKRLRSEIASVVRSLGEGFLRIEQMKLELQRDNERLRAEVELKRTGMLLDSQREIAEMFTRALTGKKGVKKRQLQEL